MVIIPAPLIEGFCALEYTGVIFIQSTWKTFFSKFFLGDPHIIFLQVCLTSVHTVCDE
jgi:hypothetical protein